MHVYNINSYRIVATDCWQLFSRKKEAASVSLSLKCVWRKSCLKNNEILLRSNHVHGTHTHNTHTFVQSETLRTSGKCPPLKYIETQDDEALSARKGHKSVHVIWHFQVPLLCVRLLWCVDSFYAITLAIWPSKTIHSPPFRSMDYLNELRWLSATGETKLEEIWWLTLPNTPRFQW